MTRVHVPTIEELEAMGDDQLAALRTAIVEAAGQCEIGMAEARNDGDEDRRGRINAAKSHYNRGLGVIASIQAHRAGVPMFRPARPVTDFASATVALKAVNRLLGLLHDEHVAVEAWLDACNENEDDLAYEVEVAHDRVDEAMGAAGTSGVGVAA